jgi:hypothetical protein
MENEKLLLAREAARCYFDAFILLLKKDYQFNWHHNETIHHLEKVEKGEIKRLILLLPPRHGKSLLSSIMFPAWYLGRNPDHEIIVSSYSADLASKFGAQTRDIINTPEYKFVFGHEIREDISAKSEWKLKGHNGSYVAVGLGGGITGRGANLLIIDDPVKNREEAESQVYREKVWDYFTSTLYTRLEKDGKIVIMITRWHFDDLVGRLLKEQPEDWAVIKYPAIAETEEKYRKFGEPLWPEKYSLDDLLKIKETIGTYNWQSLYQQTPIAIEGQEFKPEWIKTRKAEEIQKLEVRKFLTIDPAMSKKDSANYTGFVINYVDKENKWNIKAFKKRVSPTELVDMIFSLYELEKLEKIGIEKTQYLIGLKPFLDEEMRKRNVFLPIVELEHSQTAKEIRIRGLIPRYESGSVFHIEGECKDLEEEMFMFPKGINDDVLDSLAYQLQIAQPPGMDKKLQMMQIQSRRDYFSKNSFE